MDGVILKETPRESYLVVAKIFSSLEARFW